MTSSDNHNSPRAHTEVLGEHIELRGTRVIDVGSGAGSLVRWMRSAGADVTGVECGEAMRDMAFAADPDHRDSYVDGVGQDLPFDDDSADVVVFSYSLHHVPEDEMVNALCESRRVLRAGGTLYVLEPLPEGPSFQVGSLIDDETYVRGVAQEALESASECGFELQTEYRYPSAATYADFEAYEKVVVGIDPTRAERMNEVRLEAQARFETNGTITESGITFHQPNLLKIFRAV